MGNWYHMIKSSMLKLASMDLTIIGYQPERKLDTMLDLSNAVSYSCVSKILESMTPEEWDMFRILRAPEVLSPDGDYHFEKTGIMNFYVGGIPQKMHQPMIECLKREWTNKGVQVGKITPEAYTAEQISNNTNWKMKNIKRLQQELQKPETHPGAHAIAKESLVESRKGLQVLEQHISPEMVRVYRIEILSNNNDSSKQDIPPDINLANGNMQHIMVNVLKYNGNKAMGDDPASAGSIVFFSGPNEWPNMDAQEFINRINYVLGEKQLPGRPAQDVRNYRPLPGEEWKAQKDVAGNPIMPSEDAEKDEQGKAMGQYGARHIDYGTTDSGVRGTLYRMRQMAQWALSHGYKELGIF